MVQLRHRNELKRELTVEGSTRRRDMHEESWMWDHVVDFCGARQAQGLHRRCDEPGAGHHK